MTQLTTEQLTARLTGLGFTVEKIDNVFHNDSRFIIKNKVDWLTGKLLQIPTKWEIDNINELAVFVYGILEKRKFAGLHRG